jgi:cytochrome c peroxidase
VTKDSSDEFKFKTPGLREITARAPYMHKGQYASLEAVVTHYISGGVDRPSRSPLIKPVQLNPQEVSDLIAFMRSLSATQQVSQSLPNLPAF